MRLVRRIGRRGAFLFFLALLDFVYAYSLWKAPRPQITVTALLSADQWAIVWAATGVIVLSGVFVRRDRVHYMFAAALKTAWGLSQLFLWLGGRLPIGWVGAVIWLAFALTVLLVSGWPESPRWLKP